MQLRTTLTLLTVAIAILADESQAQTFRIDTDVFQEGINAPVSQNVTLFADGMVYDFMLTERNKEIAIYDSQQSLFVLLDPVRRVRTSLTTQHIRQINGSLREQGAQLEPEFFTPRFERTYDENTGWLTLQNARITYRVRGITPTNAGPIAQYREFADWYARLNATKPGTVPPFPRLELNHAIQAQRIIPTEVQLTIKSSDKEYKVRSTHLISWDLSSADLERIEDANQYWGTFKGVPFKDYRLSQVAANKD